MADSHRFDGDNYVREEVRIGKIFEATWKSKMRGGIPGFGKILREIMKIEPDTFEISIPKRM